MRSTTLRLLLLLVTCGSATPSQDRSGIAASNTTGNLIYITHVTVVDVEAGKETHDQTVIISEDRISEVRDRKGANPPANAKIVDARGKFLIPGLWDMHVYAVFAERIDSMFPMFVANGVRTSHGQRSSGQGCQATDRLHLNHRVTPRLHTGGNQPKNHMYAYANIPALEYRQALGPAVD
jgi:imidazolonepropionase-like amidohydrolase